MSRLDNSEKIIDLGMHPYADTFISEEQKGLSEPVYPLECYLNKETGQIQVGCLTKADERYNLYEYSYTSSNSKFARNHWQKYAETVPKKMGLKPGAKIMEIGSNDGFLCQEFQKLGYDVLGIDSSEYMSKLAEQNGVKAHCCVFTRLASQDIRLDYGDADLVVANNVFNHSNDPEDFVQGVSHLLKENGMFVFELPYWLSTVQTKKFDQIYHEHVNYFTVKFSFNLLAKAGLEIVDVEEVDYHGGSLRVTARKLLKQQPQQTKVVKKAIEREEELGLFDPKTYRDFMREITISRDKFLSKLYQLKAKGIPVIGVGAAAKGNTFLNFYNIDNTVLDYVTDASPHKQGKFTPLTRIPIVGDDIFAQYEEVCALILSWNISDIIKEKLLEINPKIEFLTIGE